MNTTTDIAQDIHGSHSLVLAMRDLTVLCRFFSPRSMSSLIQEPNLFLNDTTGS